MYYPADIPPQSSSFAASYCSAHYRIYPQYPYLVSSSRLQLSLPADWCNFVRHVPQGDLSKYPVGLFFFCSLIMRAARSLTKIPCTLLVGIGNSSYMYIHK